MNILVLCTGNSARSILGEVLINTRGGGVLTAYSAGSKPAGQVNPGAIAKLEREGLSTEGLRSKSWDEFTGDSAPEMSIVITVCDNAAGETCPVWHGSPVTVHWGIPDPAGLPAEETDAAFDYAFGQLARRVDAMVRLPLGSLDAESTQEALTAIHALAESREQDAD